ncbi:MAG: DNA-protecting protein DprA [Hydrogenibacillus sp.]|nr:DNA-protecting protein DprA [Hydrogenibacillus sp.]
MQQDLRSGLLWMLARVPGIGRRTLRALLEALSGRLEALLDGEIDLTAYLRDAEVAHRVRKTVRRDAVARAAERLSEDGIDVISWKSASYPAHLAEIPDPPAVLYALGRPELLARPAVALVGTRAPSAYGIRAADALARALSVAGWTVVSGLALGIDAAAHRAALTGPGSTIAVLGGGLYHVYPKANEALFRAIAEQGLILSEYPPDERPNRAYFPERNRIVSGLSRGVVVVEGHGKSGALITAAWALEQGRDVFAVPGPIFSPKSDGPHRLIQEGAKLVTRAQDILDEYLPVEGQLVIRFDGQTKRHMHETPRKGAAQTAHAAQSGHAAQTERTAQEEMFASFEFDPLSQALLRALERPVTLDALIEQSGASAPKVLAALTRLELAGHLRRLPGGRYVRGD